MTVTTYGPHGEPIIDNPPTRRADLNQIITYAVKVGNRKVGTRAQRLALTGSNVWDGLEFYETDTTATFHWRASLSGWQWEFAPGTTQTSGMFVPASGWAIGSGTQVVTFNKAQAQVYVSFTRTGSGISVASPDGNIPNVVVGTLQLAPIQDTVLASGRAGRLAAFVAATNGQVSLTAVSPNIDIFTGDSFSFGGSFLLAG